MRSLNRSTAAELLSRQGVAADQATKVLGGFDFTRPVYEHDFWTGDVLYQLVRLPSVLEPSPTTGSWFGLAGIKSSGVAINDGLAGRRLVRYRVAAPFKALEGTAARLAVDLGAAIGGPGGATQVFVPQSLRGHLHAMGPEERW